ncbi:unnamed protein product [Camellia sinensis]
MDMKAGYGGFAAALHDYGIDCWVINVVPVSGFNTLPVIYDRGLVGVMHDWCEPFDTYPRTYDLLNEAGLFSIEEKRSLEVLKSDEKIEMVLEQTNCNMSVHYSQVMDNILTEGSKEEFHINIL